jgi:hypothetical protein
VGRRLALRAHPTGHFLALRVRREVIDSPMQAYEGMRAILRRARPPPQVLITDEDPVFRHAVPGGLE